MKRSFFSRRKPFIYLPRHARSEAVIKIKNKIRHDASGRGLFTSYLVLDEPGRPELFRQNFSFYLPGKDRLVFWNVNIETAKRNFWDKIDALAFEKAWGMLSEDDCKKEARMEFEPADLSPTGKPLNYRLVVLPKATYPQFDGLTFDAQCQKLEREIIQEAPPEIFESFSIDKSYEYGIGLTMVVDEECIDQEAITRAIHRFQEMGEKEWVSSVPVPREKLPSKTMAAELEELSARKDSF